MTSGKCLLIKSLKAQSFTLNRRASDFIPSVVVPYKRTASPYFSML